MEPGNSANYLRTVKEHFLYNYKDYLPHALLSLFGLLSMIGFFMVGGNATEQCLACSHSSALRVLLNETSQDDKYYQFLRHLKPHIRKHCYVGQLLTLFNLDPSHSLSNRQTSNSAPKIALVLPMRPLNTPLSWLFFVNGLSLDGSPTTCLAS